MKVTRLQVVSRGLRQPVPQLRRATLFRAGSLFEVNKSCSPLRPAVRAGRGLLHWLHVAQLRRHAGVFLTPIMILAYKGVIGTTLAIVLAGVGSLVFPACSTAPPAAGGSCSTTCSFPIICRPTGKGHGGDHND
jgi:hypothetical protein